MNKKQQIALAAWFYSLLIRLYPKQYKQTFHAEMVQTFKDNYKDMLDTDGKVGLPFWINFVSDDLKGIGREQVISIMKIPLMVLIVFCLLISSTILTIKISPLLMLIMLTVIVFTTVFFFRKLSNPVRKSKKTVKKSWLKYGFLYGMLLGLFLVPINTVNMLTIHNVLSSQSLPLGLLFLAGVPLLVMLSAYKAGQWSKDAKQGLFSGLLTASIGAGFIVVSTIILLFIFWEFAATNASNVSYMVGTLQNDLENSVPQFHWSPNLSANVVTTFITLIFGAVLGAIGGLIGKKSARL